MAKPDHKGAAHAGTPINPLSRPYWTLAYTDPSRHEAATLAGITTAIHTLARVLSNSEAFRDLQANCEDVEPGCAPLDTRTTEGLFAALYFLSEQAQSLSQTLEPTPTAYLDPSDVPY
jgi:hypothetical protein